MFTPGAYLYRMTREHLETALDALEFKARKFQAMLETRRLDRRTKDMLAIDIANINAARDAIAELFGVDLDGRD